MKQNENQINLMMDKEFIVLRSLLDSLHRRLHAQGVGYNAKPTEALTQENEDILWDCGVLNQNFYLNRGSEHCELKLSQFCREVVKVDGQSIVQYTYSERGLKNQLGILKQLRTANKVVHQYESDCMDSCYIHILDTCISKLPNGAKEKGAFCLKPRTITPEDPSAPWFMLLPVGRNSLGAMVKTMASQGELSKDVTNHSLCAYGVKQIFSAKVPEKIMERSGPSISTRRPIV